MRWVMSERVSKPLSSLHVGNFDHSVKKIMIVVAARLAGATVMAFAARTGHTVKKKKWID